MIKRGALAVVAVFVVWSILDFVIHGVILQPTYEATAELWQPVEEMKMPLMSAVTLIYTVCFVSMYGLLISDKSLATGLKFGALFGIAGGIGMGFGSYCYMPIPLSLAWAWFLGTLVELTVAGALVGAIVKTK